MLYYSFKYPKMGYFRFWRWCLDMNINHQLKFSFLDFLSNQTFFNSEFKNIRAEFIKYSPEYEPKRFYSKIYIIFRELVRALLHKDFKDRAFLSCLNLSDNLGVRSAELRKLI